MRLSLATLDQIADVQTPAYDRSSIRAGILHLGVGAFHRAHQAVYTDDLLNQGVVKWGIVGVSLRSDRVQQRLRPQDCLYTVGTKFAGRTDYRAIGSLLDVLVLEQQRKQIMAFFSDPKIQVVTLTITEKGYCAGADGHLDLTHSDVQYDLDNSDSPRSAPGLLVAGLRARRQAGAGPLTVVSCDNLLANGKVTRQVIYDMAANVDIQLPDWLEDNVSFPCTMVDRIVPPTQDADFTELLERNKYEDAGLVTAEPFSQWVIEDDFAAARPDWGGNGAQWVDSTGPFESAKLRLLNASHSALAYWGLQRGFDFIHEAAADPVLLARTAQFMAQEAGPLLDLPAWFDIDAYQAVILERFSNPAVPYPTRQVAGDGSLKLPQRIFPTILDSYEKGREAPLAHDIVAAWLSCLLDPAIEFSDPASTEVASCVDPGTANRDVAQMLAEQMSLFRDLRQHGKFIQALVEGVNAYRGA